jgi:hypothetical protein
MYRSLPIIALAALMAAGSASAESNANKAEEVHPPTNRVGAGVPSMSTDKAETKEQAKADSNKEKVHPPTGRAGKAVPEMTDSKSK